MQRFERALHDIETAPSIADRYMKAEALEEGITQVCENLRDKGYERAGLIVGAVGLPVFGAGAVGIIAMAGTVGPAALFLLPVCVLGGGGVLAVSHSKLGQKISAKHDDVVSALRNVAGKLRDMKADIFENHFDELCRDRKVEALIEKNPAFSQQFAKYAARQGRGKTYTLPKPPQSKPEGSF